MDKLERAPDHGRVAVEAPMPEQVAQQDDRLRVLAVGSVGGDERTAVQRRHAEVAARVRRELDGRDILRQLVVSRGEIPGSPARGDHFRALELTQVAELRPGDTHIAVIAVLVDDDQVDHAVGALVRERVRQESVKDAENSGCGADPQRERNDGSEREPGLPAKLAPEEAKILPHVV